jgi:hypothetical protein
MKRRFVLTLLLGILLLLTACNLPNSSEPTATIDEGALRTSVAETLLADLGPTATEEPPQEQEQPPSNTPEPIQPPTDTVMPSPTDTLAPTLTFTLAPSPTDTTPMVSVSVDTNCRSGPGVNYAKLGALLVGEKARIVARAETGFYWIIENPDGAGTCWLWAEYATVTGDTSGLLVMTAPPSPTPTLTNTPAMAFTVNYDNYHNCGGTVYMTFYVANTGSVPLESAEVAVVQVAGAVPLFESWTDAPFVGTANGCPPGALVLGPGAAAYIAVPVGPWPPPPPNSGQHAATFGICSADGLSGMCLLKEISFNVP